MKKLLNLLKWDIKLQIKYNIWSISIVVSLFYVVIGFLLPDNIVDWGVSLILFADPSIMGMFFVGALYLFEKNERTLEGMSVIPLELWQYMLSKLISLTLVALVSAVMIVLLIKGFDSNMIILLLSMMFTSFVFSGIGFLLIPKIRSFNDFIAWTAMVTVIINLPLLFLFGVWNFPPLTAIPSYSMIKLFLYSVGGNATNIALHLIYLAIWTILLFALSYKAMKKTWGKF